MIRILSLLFFFLVILLSNNESKAQLYKLSQKPIFDINGEGYDDDKKIDPTIAERLYWVIETKHDEKFNNPWQDSTQLILFNEQLEFVLSCKRLKELHISIIDEVIHFPDHLKRIKELDSLRILTMYFDDPIFMTTFDSEVILTDEIEEFSYRPFNLSLLRGMNQLEFFATNWNAEVHDQDALLDLTSLKYAQVPVASLQPDFFKNTNLEYVQCGDQLKLIWHKKYRKMKPYYEGLDLRELFFDDTISLRIMEEESINRKKTINWNEAFLQLNNEGNTVFQLKGSDKNYSIDFLKETDNCERNSSKYRLERNKDKITVTVNHGGEISRKSSVELINGDTTMKISYVRLMKWKEREIYMEIKDHFVNGKRTGNYDLLANGLLNIRREYLRDSLTRKYPDNYGNIFEPYYTLIKESDNLHYSNHSGARLENDKIVELIWKPEGNCEQIGCYRLNIEVNDTILDGETCAINGLGDTILLMNYENGIPKGRRYKKYIKDGKSIMEDIFYLGDRQLYGTIDDGTYIKIFDHRKGVYCRFKQTYKANGIVIAQTFYHADSNEVEYLFYDKSSGELKRSKIQRLENRKE